MNDKLTLLLNDDNNPFNNISEAEYLAEIYYPENVIISTKEGDKFCKTERSNAWQTDGSYSYFFEEIKKE